MASENVHVTCDMLRSVVEPGPDRVAVLVLLKDVPGKPNGEIQLVTWGRTAADKSEAHNLKEWIKDEVFGGEAPEARTHESFILDAAKVAEQRDELLVAVRDALGNCETCRGETDAARRCARCRTFLALVAKAEGA